MYKNNTCQCKNVFICDNFFRLNYYVNKAVLWGGGKF